MPIDPKRLTSLAGAVKPPAKGKRFGIEGAKAVPSKGAKLKSVSSAKPESSAEGDDEVEIETSEGKSKTTPNPQAVIPFLEQYAEEVQNCCDEVDYDVLTDPELEVSPDNAAILVQGASDLPPRLARLLENFNGITYDDAAIIASAMQDREKTDDADQWAGWIFRIGQLLSGEIEAPAPEGEEDPEAEDGGEEE